MGLRSGRISIHALREEGDTPGSIAPVRPFDFYPRPPRGGRPGRVPRQRPGNRFLSTPSARRATRTAGGKSGSSQISIHALREEGDEATIAECRIFLISIHALREEGDHAHTGKLQQLRNFYPRPPRGGRRVGSELALPTELFLSTPSARRATSLGIATIYYAEISIHALREEGDNDTIYFAGSVEISIHALREEGDC